MSTPHIDYYPKRIVCLTDETTEMLYILGEQDRIVGVSGFSTRPAQVRQEKPKVSAFTSARINKILALKPDLVLGFSDLQADIAADLAKAGIQVHLFNQRSISEIFNMIAVLGAMVGASKKAHAWIAQQQTKLDLIQQHANTFNKRPIVYFEEWNDPIITGIQWVSELITLAGGQECFPELSNESLAKKRIVEDPLEVVKRNPDIIIGSWCGKKFHPHKVGEREGWHCVNAVVNQQVFEIKSAHILQPGPAALTDGLDQIVEIIQNWQETEKLKNN